MGFSQKIRNHFQYLSNNSHYMTAYKLHELVSVGKGTYKYLDVQTGIEL